MTSPGALLISLDFELHWGVRDKRGEDQYRANLLGARQAVPAMLELFARFGVHATWAVVGFLLFRTRQAALAAAPRVRPQYQRPELSPYALLEQVGPDEEADPLHFAASLVERIRAAPGQEIACHTFSHYYCLEPGQTAESFAQDLDAFLAAAEGHGIRPCSLVFPRNQAKADYLPICAERGFTSFRGPKRTWCYQETDASGHGLGARALRLADSYVNLTGPNTYRPGRRQGGLLDLPATAFLRPWNPRLRLLEPLKLQRIRQAMTQAARTGRVLHLWWHPHNFGTHLEQNLAGLESLLGHFALLRDKHGLASLTMAECAARAAKGAW